MAAGPVRVVVGVAATATARTTAVGHVVGRVHENGPREPIARVPVRDAPQETAETVVRARQPVHRYEERRRHGHHSIQLAGVQGTCR